MRSPQPSPQSKKFRYYTTREYFDELIIRIRGTKPGDRVLLMSMTFDPTEPTIAVLCAEIIQAASRGVHVRLSIDAHSFMLSPRGLPGPLLNRRDMPKKMPAFYKNKLRFVAAINGFPTGHAEIINKPERNFTLPIAGRSHIKIALINDRVYIGGCNLQGDNQIDLMLGWRDPDMSGRLYRMMEKILHDRHAGRALSWVDRELPMQDDGTIYIDSGVTGQSIILEEALALIDASERWLVLTCQFFPNSITARHLARAMKRGVKVEILYTHPRHHGFIGGTGQQISILRERTRVPRALFSHGLNRKDPMLHAKLIASDAGVMLGSHNYVRAGVLLGTAEIAFKSTDETLAREAVKALRRGLRKTME